MNFCNQCGEAVELTIPDGDNRERYVCTACDFIHYQNPRIIAGCIAEYDNKILLCKRAIEPRLGQWTLPAGFMENNETTIQAAQRETFEEATAQLKNIQLFCTVSIPHISQVYIMYRGQLADGFAKPGIESLETKLFSEDQIDWDTLAFPVIRESLKLYFTDQEKQQFNVHNGEIFHSENKIISTFY